MNITDICNLALNHIGREQIADLNEDTEAARTCKLHYDLQRQVLLRAYTWSFAKKYVKLSEIDVKTPGWKYTYAYPNDCVMARKIYNEDNTWCILWKNRIGNFDQVLLNDNTKALVCNHKDAYLEYTYDVKDADLFTADFAQALSYYLAAVICVPLTGSESLSQQMQAQGNGILQEAKFTMMGERNRYPEYPSKYFKARW
jgi:hypothetical protein